MARHRHHGVVVVTDAAHLDAARRIVVDELAQLDLACSRFRSDSEVARLATRGNAWTPVSDVLADVLACALDVARATDGDVDPTMGTDMSRLGYDRDFGEIQHATGRRLRRRGAASYLSPRVPDDLA